MKLLGNLDRPERSSFRATNIIDIVLITHILFLFSGKQSIWFLIKSLTKSKTIGKSGNNTERIIFVMKFF